MFLTLLAEWQDRQHHVCTTSSGSLTGDEMMLRSMISGIGRRRLAAVAAGATVAAASALAYNSDCLSLSLDDAAAADLKKGLAEAALAALSNDDIIAELQKRLASVEVAQPKFRTSRPSRVPCRV